MHDALFAVVDLETTGFSPLVGDRIIEVAIIRMFARLVGRLRHLRDPGVFGAYLHRTSDPEGSRG